MRRCHLSSVAGIAHALRGAGVCGTVGILGSSAAVWYAAVALLCVSSRSTRFRSVGGTRTYEVEDAPVIAADLKEVKRTFCGGGGTSAPTPTGEPGFTSHGLLEVVVDMYLRPISQVRGCIRVASTRLRTVCFAVWNRALFVRCGAVRVQHVVPCFQMSTSDLCKEFERLNARA